MRWSCPKARPQGIPYLARTRSLAILSAIRDRQDEVVKGILVVGHEIVENHQRWGIAGFLRAIGSLDLKANFGHRACYSGFQMNVNTSGRNECVIMYERCEQKHSQIFQPDHRSHDERLPLDQDSQSSSEQFRYLAASRTEGALNLAIQKSVQTFQRSARDSSCRLQKL